MQFELTEEQAMTKETARRFAADEIAPTLIEEEARHAFNIARVAKMGELGFFSCAVPEEYGGSGMGFMESVLMAEEIAKVSASWRVPFNMQNLGTSLTVAKYGNKAQKEKYIPGGIAGRAFSCDQPDDGRPRQQRPHIRYRIHGRTDIGKCIGRGPRDAAERCGTSQRADHAGRS